MYSVCCCSLQVWRRSSLKKGPPLTYFCPALDPPLDGSGRKTTTLVRDHEYFIPTKFHKYPLSGYVGKADYVFPYIYMHLCLSEEEVSWRRGPPVTYFCPALDPPLGGSGRKTTTLVRDHEYFIPTKFHQNPSSSSGEEVENVKSLRHTDGRRTVRFDNSSLEPSAPVS